MGTEAVAKSATKENDDDPDDYDDGHDYGDESDEERRCGEQLESSQRHLGDLTLLFSAADCSRVWLKIDSPVA